MAGAFTVRSYYKYEENYIMAMTKKPVKGMKDILPDEMRVRDYAINLIKETYKGFGFTPIETPCIEHIGNLSNKQGGENEKLIFKILKRGAKLDVNNVSNENDLVDSGLRYDMTVPLCRYYSNNSELLSAPFKSLQIGSVWRADRPQRGRFRQFTQCDIDILGDPTNLAEIELILATTTLLGKLEFANFKVHINDRRILKAMTAYSGFPEDQVDTVFIILDKMDKIGKEGVQKELLASDFSEESVNKYMGLFDEMGEGLDALKYLGEKLEGHLDAAAAQSLEQIITSVQAAATVDFDLAFDPTLVRGMGYYTGTIFEIEMLDFGSSVAGGGRYDELIGKFTGMKVPACGFSIGFERIITLLMERGFQVPEKAQKKAYLIEKGMSAEGIREVIEKAQEERKQGMIVSISMRNKNAKFQKEQLTKDGYTEIIDVYKK